MLQGWIDDGGLSYRERMKKALCPSCGKTVQISGRLAGFVGASIQCAECSVASQSRRAVTTESTVHRASNPQRGVELPQKPFQWLQRPIRKALKPFTTIKALAVKR